MPELFADSYALVAFLEGNERYVKIFRHKALVTSAMNVLEVYATLLRRIGRAEAREIASALNQIVTEVPPEVALDAGDFRYWMRRNQRDCSYIDAWGYAASRSLGLPFLTGDPAFKRVAHVEFVR